MEELDKLKKRIVDAENKLASIIKRIDEITEQIDLLAYKCPICEDKGFIAVDGFDVICKCRKEDNA